VSLLVVLALAPLWLLGTLGRGLWTPDEPREADIAWRMSLQEDRTLPHLAGVPFLEKPPLSYWMSAATLTLFGDSAAAARAPNLLYAVIAALSVAALALAMQAEVAAAVIAAVVAMSALTAFRVSVWLAPDACLLAGSALALLGAWRGYTAAPGTAKAAGYALMHVGAALLALIIWERRWQELRRWELYAGFLIQALIIGPWLLAVARQAHAAETLSALFWHNLVGRFTRVAAPAALDYTRGHHNSPGKYLLELPLYLLPWTLLVAAALVRAWRRTRRVVPEGTAWRFALCASVPFLVLLSFAATARDVYAAPALLGFGLLVGLWAHDARNSASRIDWLAVRGSRWLVALIAWALAGALGVFAAAGAVPWAEGAVAALAVVGSVHGALLLAARAGRTDDVQQSLGWIYSGYAAALCLAAIVVLPVIDRWQDLSALARRIHVDTAHQRLALLDPDETTIAMLDFRLETPFTILTAADAGAAGSAAAARGAATPAAEISKQQLVADWFRNEGPAARVLVLLPGHAPGTVTQWLARFLPRAPADDDGVAAALIATGTAALVERYELPQGRRYALLGPPP
jgi:4-amino-4-deoxy-L-arabinose transferase-like glycosyltransferase